MFPVILAFLFVLAVLLLLMGFFCFNEQTYTEEQVLQLIEKEYTHDGVIIQEGGDRLVGHASNEYMAKEAADDRRTLVWAKKKWLYKSDKKDHAEIKMINEKRNPNKIKTLHITNSPCSRCSFELRKYFKDCAVKPTIYFGRLNNAEDDRGLKDLLNDNFGLEVWEKLHQRRYPGDPTTAKYLKKLKRQVNN